MISLEKIDSVDHPSFSQVWRIYEEALPSDERRKRIDQETCFANPRYVFYAIVRDGDPVGLLTEWSFDTFTFGEHFAVHKSLRNSGIGEGVLTSFFATRELPFVVEADPPEDKISRRRVAFYERRGIVMNSFDYIQPAYAPEKNPVVMKLMSYPQSLTSEEFIAFRKIIHKEVYGLNRPLVTL